MAFERIAVIGAGVIGEALVVSLGRFGIPSESILVAERRDKRRIEILQKYRVAELTSVESVDAVLLAVKPQDVIATIREWELFTYSSPLVVSFAAGIKISTIEQILGDQARVIRVMPNTPMTLGRGMSAISLGSSANQEDHDWINRFLSTTGEVISVSEELQDAVTATSGSGPAYFFAFTEAVVAAAVKLGLSEAQAMTLAKQTLIGAALMVEKSGRDLRTLRENVTSPNGTTAAALKQFSNSGLVDLVFAAMKAAHDRSIELSL